MTNQDTKTELLPCPFCGGEAKYTSPGIMGCVNVSCGACGATSMFSEDDGTGTRNLWNTRAQPVPAANAEALDPVVNGVPLQMYLDCWADNPQQAICDLVRYIRSLQRPAPVDVAKVRELLKSIDDKTSVTTCQLIVAQALRLLDSAGEVSLEEAPDFDTCPNCGGPADNGHDRELPPNPYFCTKCSAPASTDTQGGE